MSCTPAGLFEEPDLRWLMSSSHLNNINWARGRTQQSSRKLIRGGNVISHYLVRVSAIAHHSDIIIDFRVFCKDVITNSSKLHKEEKTLQTKRSHVSKTASKSWKSLLKPRAQSVDLQELITHLFRMCQTSSQTPKTFNLGLSDNYIMESLSVRAVKVSLVVSSPQRIRFLASFSS